MVLYVLHLWRIIFTYKYALSSELEACHRNETFETLTANVLYFQIQP
jgi:hypothetical protein